MKVTALDDTSHLSDTAEQKEKKSEEKAKPMTSSRIAAKQLELQSVLSTTHDGVNYLYKKKGMGLLGKEESDRPTLKKKENELGGLQRNLTKCKKKQERQQRFRDNLKRKLESLDDDTRKKTEADKMRSRYQR